MRPQRPISGQQRESLRQLLMKVKTKTDFQRVECVWLRAALGLPSRDVAAAIGWSAGRVRVVQSRYLRDGESALIGVGRGGRRRENLTKEQEDEILGGFFEKAKRGGVLVVTEMKAAYEKAVGHAVPKSTVYRMLRAYSDDFGRLFRGKTAMRSEGFRPPLSGPPSWVHLMIQKPLCPSQPLGHQHPCATEGARR